MVERVIWNNPSKPNSIRATAELDYLNGRKFYRVTMSAGGNGAITTAPHLKQAWNKALNMMIDMWNR